ncbi:MAG: tyrosine-type recombinase/integrase [Candidatus Scalindua sediminis]|nr:tyrosine-type recombinase/integrase [Candidatus Scalindua sediminis]
MFHEMKEYSHYIPGFERHMLILQGLSPLTAKHYRSNIKEFFLSVTGRPGQPAGDVGNVIRQDVEDYLEQCFYRGNKNPTRLTKLIALRKFFRYLVYLKIIKEDPTAHIPSLKTRKGIIPKFTKKEILRLFGQIDITTEKGIRDTVILILGVFCGLRIGEILRLNISDIIDDGKTIDVNIIETKHGANRTIETLWKAPLLFVRQWLATRLSQGANKEAPFLIAYRKGDRPRLRRPTSAGIDRHIKKLAAAAGIRKADIYMHMLRATHASDLRHIKGHDVFSVADHLGHKNIETTARYVSSRGRKSKEYSSLAAYWREFGHLWDEQIEH